MKKMVATWALVCAVLVALAAPARGQDLASFEKRITVKVLDNGLTVLVCERHEAPVFSFFTYVDVGSDREAPGTAGLAHLFEHMAFKGTETIGTPDYPAEKVALAKVEEAYAAYDLERRRKIGHDEKKVAELEKAWKDAIDQADKYVKPHEFDTIVEENGGVGSAFDHPGLFQISAATKSGTTAKAIDAVYAEIVGLKTTPPTEDELRKAKDSILNSFVFEFDSKGKVLAEQMSHEFYGYPADFLERYRAGIEKVTLADVERVAEKYVHKDRLAILVVGKASDFDRPLSSSGAVTALDITIPPPGGGKPAAATASGSNAEGKALLAKIVEAMGGKAKITSVRSLRMKASLTLTTPQGEMPIQAEGVSVFPDRSWQKMMGLPMGDMVIVLTPEAAFMAAAQGAQDMPASMKEEGLKDLLREPLLVAQHVDDPKYVFSAGKTEKVGDVETRIIDVNAAGAEVRWFVDPRSGQILRASWQGMGMSGPAETVADYSDWKSVDGIFIPFKETRTENGAKAMSIEVKEVELNPAIDPKIFEKPAAAAKPD